MKHEGNDSLIDMQGALTIEDMARLLKLSPLVIRRLLKAGQFNIAPMPEINRTLRWWGPSVRAWCEQRSEGIPAPAMAPAAVDEPAPPEDQP